MILFVNVNQGIIELYSEDGVVRIPFADASQLYNHIEENSNVLYVTNAINTSPIEVVNMIKGMGVVVKDPIKEEKNYIHVAGEEIIPIDDLLRFRGHYDVHPITPDLIQKIKDTPLLQLLIKNKKLELITYSRRKELEEERVRKEDERLGSILVDREELDNKVEHGDAEVIDFTSDVISHREGRISDNIDTMSDLSELIPDIEGI